LNPAKPIAGLPEDRLLTVGAADWLERGSLIARQSWEIHLTGGQLLFGCQ
jgi:hypothetical protein